MQKQKMTGEKTHAIYVVVTSTGTMIAKAIRRATHVPYSHVSLATDATLQQMFSFCRNYPHSPLPATFNEELIGEGLLGHFSAIPCEIYKIPVTETQYRHFQRLLAHFRACRAGYSYSLMGLLRVRLQIKRELHNKFVCSQFVAYMLEECGVTLDKSACLYAPDDLRFLPQAQLIYRGELNRYYREQVELADVQPIIRSAV